MSLLLAAGGVIPPSTSVVFQRASRIQYATMILFFLLVL